MFFFKKKKIILECFTYDEDVYEYAKIDRMIKFAPEWWKKQKKIYYQEDEDKHHITIKACPSVMEFHNKAITIPFWSNLEIVLHTDNTYSWTSSSKMSIVRHNVNQYLGFAEHDGYNIKINAPWQFRTRESKYFTWSSPFYNNRSLLESLHVMPGCIEFKYNRSVNINYFAISPKIEKKLTIKPFSPLAALHPMFEEPLEIKNYLVSEKEFYKLDYSKRFFLDHVKQSQIKGHLVGGLYTTYNERKKIVNHVEANREHSNKSKCPFGFK